MSAYEREVEVAIQAVESAGRLTLEHFGTALEVETKADSSPVTVADRGAEKLIRKHLDEAFPDDGQLGEEFPEKPSRSGRRWIIDPIDGTQSFIRGVPLYGVLLGLEEGDRCVVGAMAFPPLSETYWAGHGGPAYRNGSVIRVSDVTTLAAATLCTTDTKPELYGAHAAGLERLVSRVGRQRGWGDCYGYALVASGRAEIMIDPLLNPWDIAAVLPILNGAGATFVGWNGDGTPYAGSGIATTRQLEATVLEVLGVERRPPAARAKG
ncbi:MAG: histidinol phosphate phosphatase [Deltaproteobacteria bacterium]|nr:histidinol phosphate phosphatase [Deltaproteobacteria bacterium]